MRMKSTLACEQRPVVDRVEAVVARPGRDIDEARRRSRTTSARRRRRRRRRSRRRRSARCIEPASKNASASAKRHMPDARPRVAPGACAGAVATRSRACRRSWRSRGTGRGARCRACRRRSRRPAAAPRARCSVWCTRPCAERGRLDADARRRAADGDRLELRHDRRHDAARQGRGERGPRRSSCPRRRPSPRAGVDGEHVMRSGRRSMRRLARSRRIAKQVRCAPWPGPAAGAPRSRRRRQRSRRPRAARLVCR